MISKIDHMRRPSLSELLVLTTAYSRGHFEIRYLSICTKEILAAILEENGFEISTDQYVQDWDSVPIIFPSGMAVVSCCVRYPDYETYYIVTHYTIGAGKINRTMVAELADPLCFTKVAKMLKDESCQLGV